MVVLSAAHTVTNIHWGRVKQMNLRAPTLMSDEKKSSSPVRFALLWHF